MERSQEAYDRFSDAVDVPLTVLAVGWLPVLVVPLVARVSASTSDVLDGIDYLVWAVFVVEYLVKVYLSPSRGQFFRHHLVDLAVIAVPVARPLRALRLLRLLRLVPSPSPRWATATSTRSPRAAGAWRLSS
jgi:voltage-gated potassium channel